MKFNKYLFFLIEGLRGKIPGLDLVMIFGAEAVIYLSAILLIYLGFKENGIYKKSIILSFISILLALLAILIIHIFIKEKRPFIKFGFKPLISFYKNLSFPSIHTTIMTIFVVSGFYYSMPISLLLLILLIWVAFARIYIGVHYPVDILGGVLIGSLSSISVILIRSFLAV